MAWKNDQVSERETEKIIILAREALLCEGDFVELGCYKGDTSLMLAEVLKKEQDVTCGKPVKKLWIYDSFEGLPEKNRADESALGVNFKSGELFVTRREVKERFLRSGLPVPIIKKAWFSELVDKDLPSRIAFAFLDGDFYESIRDSLNLIEEKVGEGSILVIHDYNNPALPGVRMAVDKWMENKNLKIEIFQSMIIIHL